MISLGSSKTKVQVFEAPAGKPSDEENQAFTPGDERQPSDPKADERAPSFQWQWEHRKGFRDYDAVVSERIEEAFQTGQYFCRVKTGKTGVVPMEIFFNDMLQYDPLSANSRAVRRVGPDKCSQRFWRHAHRLWSQGYDALTGHKPIRQFADYERHRRELLEGIVEKPYSVEDMYKTTGCWQYIARNHYFQTLTYVVISINAIWMYFDTSYHNNKQWDKVREVMQYLFCVYFTGEIIIRFLAFREKKRAFLDHWFAFDFFLVVVMLVEIVSRIIILVVGNDPDAYHNSGSALRVLRMLKLARLGRFARLIAAFPELMTLVKGILHALRSVLFTALLIFILIWVFAIYFTTHTVSYFSSDQEIWEYFGTFSSSCWYLLMCGVFVDGPIEILNEVKEVSPTLTGLFIIFMCIASLTVLNMLIGILCTVVDRVYQTEKDEVAVKQLRYSLEMALEAHSQDGNPTLVKNEFDTLLQNPEVVLTLARFGVDTADLRNLKEGLYSQKADLANMSITSGDEVTPADSKANVPCEPELSFEEFIGIVLRLRGGNFAKVNDIVELREYIKMLLDSSIGAAGQPRLGRAISTSSWQSGSLSGGVANDWERRDVLPRISEGGGESPPAPVTSSAPQARAAPEDMQSQILDFMNHIAKGQQQLLAKQQELEARQEAWQKEFREQQLRFGEQLSSLSMRIEASNTR